MRRRDLPTLAERLDAHCAALAACRRCAHEDPAVLPVLSGARDPVAMLVGQAPGKTEVTDRKPFAGRAGRTLFRWLASVGIEETVARSRIYISAVTRCYPGSDPSGRGDRVPSPREQALCASWLDAELALVAPRVLIPVGRLAIRRFLGDRPLASVVGRATAVRHASGEAIAIPLPHPSGASSWIHVPEHQRLLHASLELIAHALPELVARDGTGRDEGRIVA